MHPAKLPVKTLLTECTVRRGRRSGPGGQHRNKVETAVQLVHDATGVGAEATERRSQAANLRTAAFRLRVNLALKHRSGKVPPRTPSKIWISRCVRGRLQVNPEHEDFPALLAEAMDSLHALEMDVRKAATYLQCTSSQLVKFLKLDPRALKLVNDHRHQQGATVYR
jgi:hypothetical protein